MSQHDQADNCPGDLIPTRKSLLGRLKDWQDSESWREFFDTYWKLIYSFGVQRGLSHEEAQEVVQETVLAVARSIGQFHYDVNGVPKLADIGLVTGVDATRSYVGTEGFAAPEGPGTPQGDLYSLGKVLYEAATGKDRQEFPELSTLLREVPDRDELMELNAVIARACRHDPKDRYPSAAAMRRDLQLLQGGKSLARLHRTQEKLLFVQRAGAVVTAVAGLIAAGWLWQARQTHLVRELAADKARLAGQGAQLADANRERLDPHAHGTSGPCGSRLGRQHLRNRRIRFQRLPEHCRGSEWLDRFHPVQELNVEALQPPSGAPLGGLFFDLRLR